MTKEELAKKKGIKLNQNKQTAAESLITSQTTVAETKQTKPKTRKTTTQKKESAKKESPKKEELKEEVSKAGRPKGKPSTKISLNVPNEYLELVNIAAGINFKGNTSSYIVELIKKDIETNGKVYEQIKAIKQS